MRFSDLGGLLCGDSSRIPAAVIEWAGVGPILEAALFNTPGQSSMSSLTPEPASSLPRETPNRSGVPETSAADILIVDNDERIVELLSWFLSKRGYSVQGAHSFAEAREVLAAGLPDLMLSDLDLGAESALVELPLLAAADLLPPTLVVSGYLNAETTERLTGMGQVLGVLSKPFDFASLEERMVSCLEELARNREGVQEPTVVAPASAPVLASQATPQAGAWVEIHPQPRPTANLPVDPVVPQDSPPREARRSAVR